MTANRLRPGVKMACLYDFFAKGAGLAGSPMASGPTLRPAGLTLDYQKIDIGAGEEIRTLDPNLGKVVLYH